MGQEVQTFNSDTIKKMKQHYKKSMTDNAPPGAIFRARTSYAVITAYKSGKVLFQGNDPRAELSKWTEQITHTPKRKSALKSSQFTPHPSLFTESHIGSDESGTGDYFGPVTTCAAYVTKEHINELKKLGVQDSKQITDKNIRTLSKELIKLNIPYSLLILHNEKYNALQSQGWSQGKMKAMLHHHAIQNLLEKITSLPYEGILVDQFCQPHIYINHLSSEKESLPDNIYFMTKAEDYSIAVAAASVIARASFLKEMENLSRKIGYKLLKGASQQVDKLIGEIIREQGESILHMCAKVHFSNTEKGRKFT